jgi:hypothetical protein
MVIGGRRGRTGRLGKGVSADGRGGGKGGKRERQSNGEDRGNGDQDSPTGTNELKHTLLLN